MVGVDPFYTRMKRKDNSQSRFSPYFDCLDFAAKER